MARNAVRSVATLLACLIFTPALFAQPGVDALGDPMPEGAIARLGTTRMRHTILPDVHCWGLGCITWSPDGKMIATSSNMSPGSYAELVGVEARLWEASTGKPLSLLENNIRYGPSVLRFSPDSKTLAAAAGDKIVLWDTATGKELEQFLGHKDVVDALAFQDGGKTMVSVSRDGAVHWWDVGGPRPVRQWQLLANDPKQTDKGDPITLRGIFNARFSADGKTLAVAKWWTTELKKPWAASLAVLFDINAEKEIWRVGANGDAKDYTIRYRFAFTPDGQRVAISKSDVVCLHETATGRQLGEADCRHTSGMDFSPDGKTLAFCGNSEVGFWSPGDKTPVRKVELPLHGGYNTGPAFSPDGKRLAIDLRLTFQVLDVATGKPALFWPSYDEGVRSLAFSADGRTLFASDGDVAIDTATWRQRAETRDPPRREFGRLRSVSMDRSLCVTEDGEFRDALRDKTGRVIAHLDIPERQPASHGGFFSPRCSVYVMCDHQCDMKETDTLFAVPSGKRLFQLSFNEFTATYGWCFSADEARVAFYEPRADMIHVYETATGKHLRQFAQAEWPVSFALAQSGNMLACATGGLRDAQIWDLRTGKLQRSLVLDQKTKDRGAACLAWSPNNHILAVGGLDGSIRLWDVASAEVLCEFRGHQAPARCLAFSPDGRFLASGSDDTTLLIWKTPPGKKRREQLTDDELSALWENLGADPGKAFEAQVDLRDAPKSAVLFLAKRLEPAPAIDLKPVEDWVKDLGSDTFRVREEAAKELERLGELAHESMRKALARDLPIETRRRLQALLGKVNPLTPSQLRSLRALEILEGVGTPEALQIIERLAQGNPDSLATAESRAVVARMKKKR